MQLRCDFSIKYASCNEPWDLLVRIILKSTPSCQKLNIPGYLHLPRASPTACLSFWSYLQFLQLAQFRLLGLCFSPVSSLCSKTWPVFVGCYSNHQTGWSSCSILPCLAVINSIIFADSLLIIILIKTPLLFMFIPSIFFRKQINTCGVHISFPKGFVFMVISLQFVAVTIIVPFFPPRVSSDEILLLFISVEL